MHNYKAPAEIFKQQHCHGATLLWQPSEVVSMVLETVAYAEIEPEPFIAKAQAVSDQIMEEVARARQRTRNMHQTFSRDRH